MTSLPPIVSIPRISIPSASVGTESIVRPSCLEPEVSERAMTRMWSAMWAAEIQVFWPLRTKPPFWRSARQERLPTSEPASGSDIAIASTRPRVIPPRISAFCSSVPKRS